MQARQLAAPADQIGARRPAPRPRSSCGSAEARCVLPYLIEVTVAHDAQTGPSRAFRCLDWIRRAGLDGIMLP